jgi:Putative porin
MRIIFFILLLWLPSQLFSQSKNIKNRTENSSEQNPSDTVTKPKVAPIDLYRIISVERDTTYIDTSLTIKKEYNHNFLRKDNFGLLPFPNEGQTYNVLQYSLTEFSPYPEMGFKAKHFSFLDANQIRYASVATPVTELYFKTTLKKGQATDVFFTMNTAPGLNFSIAYKGLRSEGKYINQLVSAGNFRFTLSYNTKTNRYVSHSHYASSDIQNGENGGIIDTDAFENEDAKLSNRDQLETFFKDAKSELNTKRFFVDHSFRVNSNQSKNNLYLTHQFNYENREFEFTQPTVISSVLINNESIARFGPSFNKSNISDHVFYNKMYNKAGLIYENSNLGKFQFYLEDFRSNYYYTKILILDIAGAIPSSINQKINSFGAQYNYLKGKWNGSFLFSRSIANQDLSNLNLNLKYDWNDDIQLSFRYQNLNKLPNNNYNLNQSSYLNYNWNNNFKNEKINILNAAAITPWLNAEAAYWVLNDHLYFEDTANSQQKLVKNQLVKPAQYGNTINYLYLKVNKEFRFRKFALDNTFLYQKVDQSQNVLNVPEIVGRNTLYYSNYFFKKKALYLQVGVSVNYFTSYYANEYNPVIGEFFVQNDRKIGNFPVADFFVNAKIQRTRIFFKAEHFNSSFTGNSFYSSPNNPYRDFTIRFGIVWNFFQ